MTTWRTMRARCFSRSCSFIGVVPFVDAGSVVVVAGGQQARGRHLPQGAGDGAVGAERAEDADLGGLESRSPRRRRGARRSRASGSTAARGGSTSSALRIADGAPHEAGGGAVVDAGLGDEHLDLALGRQVVHGDA